MNKKLIHRWSAAALTLLFVLSACTPTTPNPGNLPDTGSLYTQAAETVAVQLTLGAGQTAVAQLTQQAAVTPTSPTQPDAPTPTNTTEPPAPTPTNTPEPPTPTPTDTPEPPTATPQPCDWAEFVGDVTVKDGSVFQPNASFTKTWRLKNVGTCSWTGEYDLVFDSGDRMSGARAVALDERVRPGETVDISVDLVAPEDPGEYLGEWQLRNAEGGLFGIGENQNKPFWVSIKVVRPSKLVWDMTEDFCLAWWSTGALDGLACPDLSENLKIGFINRHPFPVVETGGTDDEPALVTYPNSGEEGYIVGVFPAFRIKKGDEFRTVIGCLADSYECSVTFQLNYRISGSTRVRSLGSWKEKHDGMNRKVTVDLSELAGEDVELILTVVNNGKSLDDWAFWLRPSIWR